MRERHCTGEATLDECEKQSAGCGEEGAASVPVKPTEHHFARSKGPVFSASCADAVDTIFFTTAATDRCGLRPLKDGKTRCGSERTGSAEDRPRRRTS